MIRMERVRDEQYEVLLEIIFHQKTSYLNPVLDLIQMTWDQFGAYFRTTGEVYAILLEDALAGVCWVEARREVLYLHGLIVSERFQGQGVGTQALSWLEEHFCGQGEAIELAVHISNPRAQALYTRCGYQTVRFEPDSGFYIMKKALPVPAPA
jgi:ribosomal protein S18 acetylase RimI-like enzyme